MCHATGGLPTCVHCHWNFSSWPAFCEHFEHKRCVALHLRTQVWPQPSHGPLESSPSPRTHKEPQPRSGPGSSTQPTAEGVQCDTDTPVPAEDTMRSLYASLPEVVLGLCSADWVPLADHVRQEDQHTCMFCKQWLARPAYLTRHIAAQHEVLREVLDALPSWLQARRPTVFSPCRWCHQDFKVQHSSRSRHVQACPTLIRTGIYLLLHRANQELPLCSSNGAFSGESGGAGLSQGASDPPPWPHGSPTWCSSWGGKHLGAHDSSPLRCSSSLGAVDGGHSFSHGHTGQGGQARQRLGLGQRSGQVPQVGPGERRGIWYWLGKQKAERVVEESQERLRRGEQEGEGRGGDPEPLRKPLPIGPEARRPTGHRSYGEGLHPVLPDEWDVVGDTGHGSVHRGVDQDEGGQPHGPHLAETGCNAEAAAGLVVHKAGSGCGDGGEPQPSQEHAYLEPGRPGSILAVQSANGAAGDKARPRAHGAQDGVGDYQGAPGPGAPAEHHAPLPCRPKADVAAQGRYCSDDAGDRGQNPGSGSGLGAIGSPMSQRGLPCSGDEPAPRANGSLSLGEVGAADGRGFVRALLLGNSRNYCYSNAAFLALLWASVEHSGMMACESPMGPSLRMIVGWLRRKSGIVHLWQHLPWVTLHASWPQPHRQHDIIEYMQFLRPRLSSEVADCQWESRQELDGYIRRVDVGSTWPLWLPAPLDSLAHPAESDTTVSVQHLVDAWQQHAGAGSQALVQSPPILLIQVNRFCLGSSRPTKSQTPVFPDPHLMLPVFQGALDQPNALEVVYARFRLSAALMHEGPAVTSGHYRTVLQDIGQQLITDDAVPVRKLCEHTDGPHCRANYYAFVYMHCQSPPPPATGSPFRHQDAALGAVERSCCSCSHVV